MFSHFSNVCLFVTLWTISCKAPLLMGFSRKEYWSGQPVPSPGALPDPVIKHESPTLQADSSPSEPPGKPVDSTASQFIQERLPFLSKVTSGALLPRSKCVCIIYIYISKKRFLYILFVPIHIYISKYYVFINIYNLCF